MVQNQTLRIFDRLFFFNHRYSTSSDIRENSVKKNNESWHFAFIFLWICIFFLSILNSKFIFKVKFSLLNYVIFVHYPIWLYYIVAILPIQEIWQN